MGSREEILGNIRKNTLFSFEKPSYEIDSIKYEDKLQAFCDMLKVAGGQPVFMSPDDDLDKLISRLYPDAKRIASNLPDVKCAVYNPDEIENSRELKNTDLSVVSGAFGVAENGAVWIPLNVKHKALYFISESLVILLDKREIVHTMHEAYKRISGERYGYGLFMSGPSKTADIEQALVFGAHGPMSVSVVLY